jgi:hypothetical protein
MRSLASLIVAAFVHTEADARVRLIRVGADRWTVGKLILPPRDSVRLLAADSDDILAVATPPSRDSR